MKRPPLLDATRIAERLYQGGYTTPELASAAAFDALVLCAEEHQPVPHPGVRIRVIRCPMDDAVLTREEWRRAVHAAREVANLQRAGHRVLVTCWAGRNRSGLVTALALNMLTHWPFEAVIQHIQRRRPGALTNKTFTAALLACGSTAP